MSDHEYEAPVDLPAEHLFEYVADPANLPDFLSAVSGAHPGPGDRVQVEADVDGHHVEGEAWFRVDEANRTLRWGMPGGDDYHGELAVHEEAADSCRIAVRLHTDRAGGGDLRKELEQAVAVLAQAAAAHTDTVRSEHQSGWAG